MSNGPPKLTIVTPVLNGGLYFEACLASVERLARALPGAVEHIIADGGSTDGTLARAHKAGASPDSPVSLVLEGPDRGQSHAINRGFARARGDWLAWLNADDEYVPTAATLFEQVIRNRAADRQANRFADADVVVGRCEFVNMAGQVVFAPELPDLAGPSDLLRPLSRWFAGRCIVQPEAVFRREVFDRVGGLDEQNHLAMDHDLWLRLLASGAKFQASATPVAVQRVHGGQKTVNNLGVARQILANCDRYFSDHSFSDAVCKAEIDLLRERIRLVDSVLRSSRGSSPMRSGSLSASMQSAVSGRPIPRGPILVVGERAYTAARLAGWDGARLVRASRPIADDAGFDAAVLDCTTCDRERTDARTFVRSVRPGGVLVLGGCSLESRRLRARLGIERALGDRVTRAGEPWSAELLSAARDLLGWTAQGAWFDSELFGSVSELDRVPIQAWTHGAGVFRTLGVDPADLGETLVLRRLPSVTVQ